MAEALAAVGAAASIVDLVGKAAKIVARIYEFQSSLGDVPKAFKELWQELPALEATLTMIKDNCESGRLDIGQSKVLAPLLKSCFEQIRVLEETIFGITTSESDSTFVKAKKGVLSLQKEKTVEKATKMLRNYNQTLTYNCLIASSSSALVKSQEKKLKNMHHWLAAPDPNANYQKALKSRHDDTGQWFIQSEKFAVWKRSPGSLWLYGIPGCGKTILSATVLENVLEEAKGDPSKILAFYYFDFNDPRKQHSELLLHSLVSQILSQLARPSQELNLLFTACRYGERSPTESELLVVLRDMIESTPDIYIILDALDECGDSYQLMELVAQIGTWDAAGLHFLVTSRREHEIEVALLDFIDQSDMIGLQSHLVDPDIRSYVQQRLIKDPALKKWQKDAEIRGNIESVIMDGAQGMFRWAACQLDSLSKCRNRVMLRKALESLPPTLDETYDRILCKIDENDADYAYRILYWLAFSKRPLRLEEVAETIAISSDRDPAFDRDEVLEDPHEALILCSSLVTVVADETAQSSAPSEQKPGAVVVVLAHYSVKEYLISKRIQEGEAKRFGMSAQTSHNMIAESCLHYLLEVEEPQLNDADWLDRNALAKYSAITWCHHARANGDAMADHLHQLIYTLFTSKVAFLNWLRIEKPDEACDGACLSRQLADLPTPIYYACMLGLRRVTEQLVANEGADVNVQGGRFGSPLQAAAISSQEATVKLLVSMGADVNLAGGRHGSPLTSACVGHNLNIVNFLLDSGAHVNATGGRYHTALQAAAIEGQLPLVELLIERGADPNIQGGRYGSALQAAAIGGWGDIAKLLLDSGADVNAVGGRYGSALQAASIDGHEKIVKILLDHGADVNLKGGRYGSPLQAATIGAHPNIVKMFIDRTADVNASEGGFGTALQAAAKRGSEPMVRMLLDEGAVVDVSGGKYGTPVQEALAGKHTAIVTMLETTSL